MSFGPETSPTALPQPPVGITGPRRAVERAALVICSILVIRSAIIEPYGVPTGSMAMTMLGNHKRCNCPRCGIPVSVGGGWRPHPGEGATDRAYQGAWCPNCGHTDLRLSDVPETTGDRLLVDKTSFEWRRPRRWEVAVFRNPSDGSKPYVKRIVGLPGERIQIRDGDVYVNEEICRKTLSESRPLRVLVFDQSFEPPQTWRDRWMEGPLSASTPLGDDRSTFPAADIVQGPILRWPESLRDKDFRWITYRHWLLDEQREEFIRDWFAYNGGAVRHELSEVHDFSVEFDVRVESGVGGLAFSMYDGRSIIHVEVPIGDDPNPIGSVRVHGTGEARTFTFEPGLTPGQTRRVEFALVDRRVSLALDGQEAIEPIDLPAGVLRRGVSRPFAIGVQGAAVTIRNFRLYRDVYYTNSGRNGVHAAWPLGRDEYFVLGDNSANSEDSRHWLKPGVPLDLFLGRPLLLHQPSRWSQLGSWRLQSLDWRRIRWVR